jgi:sulfofructose kinase
MVAIPPTQIDVLCVGQASYDLVFSVSRHPLEDEKIFADGFFGCGGGPAANAAVAVSRLGFTASFAGYLGQDIYGEKHYQELVACGIDTQLIVRGSDPTPISAILVKQDGKRALINYKGDTKPLISSAIDFTSIKSKAILFDGHEPYISSPLAEYARAKNIPTVLDAGSLHEGTLALMERVDYLVCSEKFARQYAGDEKTALTRLAKVSPAVVITLGEKGVIWRRRQECGSLPAFPITALDTTGAGDAFHGAFAAAVAANMDWLDVLRYASAAGALCCTKTGARPGLPTQEEHSALLEGRDKTR